MTSPAKAAANAANARLSTGPATPEGKAISSQNAVKHGLTAKHVVVREDEIQDFNDLRDFMFSELDPQGAIELQTFNILMHASWNIERFRTLEASLMVNGLDPVFDDSATKTLDRIHRYHREALRNYHKAMSELRNLQTSRALKRATLDEEEEQDLPVLVSMKDFLKATQAEVRTQSTLASATAVHQIVKAEGMVANAIAQARRQNEPTAKAREGR